MNENFQKLPPEMQARINNIINQASAQGNQPAAQAPGPVAQAPAEQAPAPAAPKPPSLMDHVIALRQEVAHLSQQVNAVGQVSEAVGNAVGELYQMFQSSAPSPTYSSTFQAQQQEVEDEGY